jgi:pSer/pThr/pTyr-binding forkhead associated (FHA) protein
MMRIVNEKEHDLALIAESGLAVGSIYPLAESRLIIGRRMDASVPVEDTKVSRDHAVVDRRNGHCLLVDLGSTNGTYLNGRKIVEAMRIKIGDHIRVGNSAFRVDLFENVKTKALNTRWNDVTRVDLQLETSPKIVRSKFEEDAAIEGSLETLDIHKKLIQEAHQEIFKKRVAFAAICLALILSAILLF